MTTTTSVPFLGEVGHGSILCFQYCFYVILTKKLHCCSLCGWLSMCQLTLSLSNCSHLDLTFCSSLSSSRTRSVSALFTWTQLRKDQNHVTMFTHLYLSKLIDCCIQHLFCLICTFSQAIHLSISCIQLGTELTKALLSTFMFLLQSRNFLLLLLIQHTENHTTERVYSCD